MTSPQKQDEQQESDQLHRATRQQDASQEGDAPRLDQTAEAAALGDNLDESQPRLAGHQDAFRGSNAEPGNPLNTDQLEDATGTRPDRDAPRAAITEAGEPMTEYSLEERGQSRLAEHQDAFRGSRTEAGNPAGNPPAEDLSVKMTRADGGDGSALRHKQGKVTEEQPSPPRSLTPPQQVANTGVGVVNTGTRDGEFGPTDVMSNMTTTDLTSPTYSPAWSQAATTLTLTPQQDQPPPQAQQQRQLSSSRSSTSSC
jgi:hypothetical protein